MEMYQPDDRDFTLKQIFMFCLFLFVFFNAVGCRDFVDWLNQSFETKDTSNE